jgi:hypothetical protein
VAEVTDIIGRWLWRFFPMIWLGWVVGRLVDWAIAILEDEEHRLRLLEDKRHCAWFGGWLALLEERLNELIVYRAMKHLKRPFWGRQPFGHAPARVARYYDAERLAKRRAQKLQRLFEAAELQLEVIHHPVEAQPSAGIVGMRGMVGMLGTIAMLGISACAVTAPHPAQRIRAPP